jgi:hypothetical protein
LEAEFPELAVPASALPELLPVIMTSPGRSRTCLVNLSQHLPWFSPGAAEVLEFEEIWACAVPALADKAAAMMIKPSLVIGFTLIRRFSREKQLAKLSVTDLCQSFDLVAKKLVLDSSGGLTRYACRARGPRAWPPD